MTPNRVSLTTFRKAGPDRDSLSMAHMATVAMNDCWNGGAKASVLAKRLERMGSRIDYKTIVSNAYTNSRGLAREYMPYECSECGCIHLGFEAACYCCSESADDLDE